MTWLSPRWSIVALLLCAAAAAGPRPAYAERHHRHAVEDPSRRAALNGKLIRSIHVTILDIFDNPSPRTIYSIADDLKISTKTTVVTRELLFKTGQRYDEFLIEETERNLRALGFFATAQIVPTVDGDSVDLDVRCRDTWTLIPAINDSSGTGRHNFSAGLGESDILGYGKRGQFLYTESDNRKGYQLVYQDPRVWGSKDSFVGGLFDRADGNEQVFSIGSPYRSLKDTESWNISSDTSNTVGRLFEDGSEHYIYRQKKADVDMRYSVATGDPDSRIRRFSFGYDYLDARFSQASGHDYQDLNLDPAIVSNDPTKLPENRRFSGPIVAYQMIQPEYISLNYIDRFERIQDFNIGDVFSADVQIAPEALGSSDDALLLDTTRSIGWRFSPRSFIRGEVGLNTRLQTGDAENTLARAEVKFYQSFEPSYWHDIYLGRHTLAINSYVDYGHRLDRDRQILAGADTSLRGYEAKTFAGNKSIVLNIEDRMHFVDDIYKLVSLGGALFLDAGGATTDPLGTIFTRDLYADVGVGLRAAFPRSSGGQVVRLDIAFPLRDGPDGSQRFSPRLLLAGGQLFDSELQSEVLGAENSNIQVGVDR